MTVFLVEERDREVGQRVDDVQVKMKPVGSCGKQLGRVFDTRDHDRSPLVVRSFPPRFFDDGSSHRTKEV